MDQLVPAAAMNCSAHVSGIKAKGSDGDRSSQAGRANLNVADWKNISSIEKKILFLTAQLPQLNEYNKKKSSSKKVQKNSSEKSSGTRKVSESAVMPIAAGRGNHADRSSSVPQMDIRTGRMKRKRNPDLAGRST